MRLRHHQRSVAGDEPTQLEAEAVYIIYGRGLPRVGFGRALLAGGRLVWMRRTIFPLLDRLLFWVPKQIELFILEVGTIELMRGGFGTPTFLVIQSEGERHFFQLGKGPFPLVRKNPETTKEWFNRISQLRLHGEGKLSQASE